MLTIGGGLMRCCPDVVRGGVHAIRMMSRPSSSFTTFGPMTDIDILDATGVGGMDIFSCKGVVDPAGHAHRHVTHV
jgi:hypothetical protein